MLQFGEHTNKKIMVSNLSTVMFLPKKYMVILLIVQVRNWQCDCQYNMELRCTRCQGRNTDII